MSPLAAVAAKIVYFDENFDDGSFGGGAVFSSLFGEATNISTTVLDGRSLLFAGGDQMKWERTAKADSNFHHVSFDYFLAPNRGFISFLDAPSILSLFVAAPGRHHVDAFYDLAGQTAVTFLDGVLDSSLQQFLVWSTPPNSRSVRFATNLDPFELDNLLWEGNVTPNGVVPEPATATLVGLGLAGLAVAGRKPNRPEFWARVGV